jgi:hypothetical protein
MNAGLWYNDDFIRNLSQYWNSSIQWRGFLKVLIR